MLDTAPTPEDAHHEIGPSSFDKVALCPGSVALVRTLPKSPERKDSPSAQGTRAHSLLEHCLTRQEYEASEYTGYSLTPAKPEHPDGDPLFTADDTAAVTTALQHVEKLQKADSILFVERKLDLSIALPGLFGRGDVAVYHPTAQHLDAVDYKHGVGVVVEAGTRQLKGYALGWLRLLASEGYHVRTIRLWIIQPRAPHEDGPIRHFDMDVLELLDWVAELQGIIRATQDPNAPRIPGKKQCQFCEGAKQLKCKEYVEQSRQAALSPFGEVCKPADILAMTPQEIGRRLEELPLLLDYAKNVQAHADTQARAGVMPVDAAGAPYKWILGRGGNRSWAVSPAQAVAIVAERTGLNISLAACESPTQTEKLLGVARFKELNAAYEKVAGSKLVAKAPGKPKLVKGDAPGDPVTLDDVRRANATAVFETEM